MGEVEIGHRWEPITDLTDADRVGASEERADVEDWDHVEYLLLESFHLIAPSAP